MSDQREMMREIVGLEVKCVKIEAANQALIGHENTTEMQEEVRQNNIQLNSIKTELDSVWANLADSIRNE